jgi:hypothetical protein
MHHAPAGPVVLRTRTADLVDPLGIGDPRPYLSGQLTSGRRGDRQIAYQVQAAGTAAGLAADRPGRGDLADARFDVVAVDGLAYAHVQERRKGPRPGDRIGPAGPHTLSYKM